MSLHSGFTISQSDFTITSQHLFQFTVGSELVFHLTVVSPNTKYSQSVQNMFSSHHCRHLTGLTLIHQFTNSPIHQFTMGSHWLAHEDPDAFLLIGRVWTHCGEDTGWTNSVSRPRGQRTLFRLTNKLPLKRTQTDKTHNPSVRVHFPCFHCADLVCTMGSRVDVAERVSDAAVRFGLALKLPPSLVYGTYCALTVRAQLWCIFRLGWIRNSPL